MEFINLENGLTYNGSKPFIHFFPNGQSVNLNYEHKLCFLSRYETLTVTLNSDVFSLIDLTKIQYLHTRTRMAQKSFFDLKQLKTNTLVSKGTKYKNQYIHVVYLLAHSSVVGEIVDVLKIGHEEVYIGADFYGEDERLKNSLENFEAVVPESIQRAIYECNVHEESNDNITLNRKYRELLQNYWNICMSKGSYTSLVDSLAWFEWGELVRLEEFWKRTDPHGDTLLQFPVEKHLNKEMYKMLSTVSKTTFYGLYCCLYKEMPDGFDEEENPLLENQLMRWSVGDISLKMILLGNFYQTYFMPIHLDLLHSTIEHWVFTVNQKIMNYNSVEFCMTFNNVKTFECDYEEVIKMKPTYLYFYDDVLFKNATMNRSGLVIPLGCSTTRRNVTSEQVYNRYYNYICAVNKFTCHIPQVNIKHSWLICRNEDGTTLHSYEDMVYGTNSTFSFELFFEKPGQWNIVMMFETIDSVTYSKELNIWVEENVYNTIDLYKLEYSSKTGFADDFNTLDELVMNLTNSMNYTEEELKNIYYINKDKAQLNHVVVYELPIGVQLHIKYGDVEVVIDSNTLSLKNYLNAHIPQYMWFVMEGRIAGVCRRPNTTEESEVTMWYSKGDFRCVNEKRFVLGFYDLIPFNGYVVEETDIIVAVPRFKYSLPIEECFWNFRNESTQEDNPSYYYKKYYNEETSPMYYEGYFGEEVHEGTGTTGNLLLYKKPKELKKGFYSIYLRYKYHNDIQEARLKSAFYIK